MVGKATVGKRKKEEKEEKEGKEAGKHALLIKLQV
jgi:hypothetical protein